MFGRRHALIASLAAGCMLGVPLLAPAPAEACMAARRPPPGKPPGVIDQAGARALLIQDGEQSTLHLQAQYYGDAADFSWIVPVPAEPKLSVGDDQIFTALREATRPRFELDYDVEGACKQRQATGAPGSSAARGPAGRAAGAPAADAGVTVVAQAAVGPYDTTVLKAEDSGSLRKWLEDNDYQLPAKLDAAIGDYVVSRYYFVALKLQKDRETGDLQPLVLSYQAKKAGIPVQLSSVSAVPDMDVYVWLLGKQRAVPDNYDLVEINEARIDWFGQGNNYRQVVTEAMNEAEGRAWVTDYAGDASVLKLGTAFTARADLRLDGIEGRTAPAAFASAIRARGIFSDDAKLWRFLARHVPKPKAFEAEPDASFYNMLTASDPERSAAYGDFSVDTAKALAEIEQTVIAPARDLKRALAENTYLTQLYTTMSPEEMTQDPTFVFNPDMGKVSNVHRAELVTVCDGNTYFEDAPRKIKLANGLSWFVPREDAADGESKRGGGSAVKIPAARRVMRCGTRGPASMQRDNANAVSRLLNDLAREGIAIRINTSFGANPRAGAGTTIVLKIPFAAQLAQAANGFGCLGCQQNNTPPVRQGAEEGATYALFAMGLLGYRRWLGRRKR